MKDRNLKVRSVAWVFDPASWQNDCFFLTWQPQKPIYSNWVNNWISTVSTTSFEESVYGKRDGVITGLAITHKDGKNMFHNSRGWKSGTVHGITMLPRGDMWKPDAKETCSLITIFICFVFFILGDVSTGVWALPFYTTSKSQCACLKGSPAASHGLPHLGRAFTDVQEQKQVPGTQLFSQVFVLYILFPKKVFTTKAKKY